MILSELQKYLYEKTGIQVSAPIILNFWKRDYKLIDPPVQKGLASRLDYETIKDKALLILILHSFLNMSLSEIQELFTKPIEILKMELKAKVVSLEISIVPILKDLIEKLGG